MLMLPDCRKKREQQRLFSVNDYNGKAQSTPHANSSKIMDQFDLNYCSIAAYAVDTESRKKSTDTN